MKWQKMAKSKAKAKKKESKSLLDFFSKLTKKSEAEPLDLLKILHVFGIVVFLGGTVFGLKYLDTHYVREVTEKRDVKLTMELAGMPEWVSSELIEYICLSSDVSADNQLWEEHLVETWRRNIMQNPWVKDVYHIRKRYDGRIVIHAEIRKPVASITQGKMRYFLDEEGVILNDQPLRGLHVLGIEGNVQRFGEPGETVKLDAVKAGLKNIAVIQEIDNKLSRSDRVWDELTSIDVGNYEGRLQHNNPHIILNTRKGVEIYWGAAVGREVPYYEQSAQDKLRTLYSLYQQTGFKKEFSPFDLRIQ